MPCALVPSPRAIVIFREASRQRSIDSLLQLVHSLVAILRQLLQRRENDLLQVLGIEDRGWSGGTAAGVSVRLHVDCLEERRPSKRHSSSQRLIHHNAPGINIGAQIDRLACCLLRLM